MSRIVKELEVSLGKHESENQGEFWPPTDSLASGLGHVFYVRLNRLLVEQGFDGFVEQLCQPHDRTGGRRSIPPGTYFRMLMFGYLEGIVSQQGIAWRCEDSLALRRFLGIGLSEETPDHSSLTRIRDRLPVEVHQEVFQYILFVIEQHGLLKAQTVGVDSTFLEANAAMKSIVRKETGEEWKAYVTRPMREEGAISAEETPPEEDIRRFGRQCKGKVVSNEDWASPTDPEAKITRRKLGTAGVIRLPLDRSPLINGLCRSFKQKRVVTRLGSQNEVRVTVAQVLNMRSVRVQPVFHNDKSQVRMSLSNVAQKASRCVSFTIILLSNFLANDRSHRTRSEDSYSNRQGGAAATFVDGAPHVNGS